ncbi:MAG: Na(+)-translocating NADH-quinone reductase subunit A [Bacteroidales bacterium]|nr:Na(+)-translocating NADH-quinone reductase subunit A [Bacteroidales bacterium]
MANIIKIKRGLNIPISGQADASRIEQCTPAYCGIVPDDFPGYKWKCVVAEGDAVLSGSPLLCAKENPEIALVSPVAGTVKAINRGERRHILSVVVEASKAKSDYVKFPIPSLFKDEEGRRELLNLLSTSGILAFIRQRPYDIVPSADVLPRDIFVTAFDSAPLAAEMVTEDMYPALERGLAALASLTDGRVYLGIPYDSAITSRAADVNEFDGPHPAGNAGVQAAAIKPVNKGETIWTLDARTAVRIGRLVTTGVLDMSAEVAVTGPEAEKPCVIHTLFGAAMVGLLKGHLPQNDKHLRIISGNVLTGVRVKEDGFLRYPYRQVTILEEGDDADEFMGWASLNPKKYSVKRSFLSRLGKKLHFDARVRGGVRAPILSGEYDKVFPMDIYPEFLLKAAEAGDIDKMEQLGIYEVAPEDFALAEFVDTSKRPLQQIIRRALTDLHKELS